MRRSKSIRNARLSYHHQGRNTLPQRKKTRATELQRRRYRRHRLRSIQAGTRGVPGLCHRPAATHGRMVHHSGHQRGVAMSGTSRVNRHPHLLRHSRTEIAKCNVNILFFVCSITRTDMLSSCLVKTMYYLLIFVA